MADSYTPFAPGPTPLVKQLREQTAAVRLTYEKFGVRRAIKGDLIADMARAVQAQLPNVSASKRLLDTSHEAWQAAAGAIGRARLYWRTMTIPFPVKGIRLLRKDQVAAFDAAMEKFKSDMEAGVKSLEMALASLVLDAQHALGRAFNPSDYPAAERIAQEFFLGWDYPSVEPPNYLKELHPELYRQQQERLERQFAEAASLAEEAFAAELQGLVNHLLERLAPNPDGSKRSLSKSALGNLSEFFERFQAIKVSDNATLEKLVTDARKITGGVQVEEIRGNELVRANLSNTLGDVAKALDGMIVTQPKRRIVLEDEE